MLTLALDTTTRAGSVAVVRDAIVLSVVPGDPARTHGERLPAELDRALRDARVTPQDVRLLAVASGPGAFTGLRIGLAAIQGMAMVLNVPVIAVSALDALAYSIFSGDEQAPKGPAVAAWMDAQRGEVFAAYYQPADARLTTPSSVPIVATPDVVLQSIPADPAVFVGDGAVRYESQILQLAGLTHRVAPPPSALAPFVARIAIDRAARGAGAPPHALQPLYVRRPDAELERLRHTASTAHASSAETPGDKR